MRIRLGAFAGILGAAMLASTAPSHATMITNEIEISSSGTCDLDCTGAFTVDNGTSDWAITGFSVTDAAGEPFETETADATTTRNDWSASASVNYVGGDTICIPFAGCFTIGASPQPTFTYGGAANFILPGEFDGSFDWSESSSFDLDPNYTFLVL